jgi:surface carbohydrate biosynthesis protein (TIGR04326 family)
MKGISNSEAKRRIIVCPPRKTSILKALRQLKGRDFRWVYLGEDVSRALAIEQRLRDTGQRLEIGSELQEIAHSLRQPYIDYIGKLSLTSNSLLWWVGSLSEKNPWVSKTFLYACYIRLCQTIVNSGGQETLVFIGENKVIRKGIFGNLVDLPQCEIQRIELPGHDLISTIRNTGRLAFLKVYLSVLTIYHILLARRYRLKLTANQKLQEGEGFFLLHNWVDPRSFYANGKYRDNYFGELAHHLTNKGKKVIIVPHILYTVPYRQTLKKLEQSLDQFLLPESFLTVSDACRIFIKTILNLPRKRVYPAFEGIDISGIIMNDLFKDWGSNNIASNLLLYEAVKRLKKAGISIDTSIYAYENQVWEKAYCLALRKFYPSARIIGYQHATVPKMLLTYFFAKDELSILPFPDKLITNGKYPEKLFKESGYDPARVVCGGAIRYVSLMNKKDIPMKRYISSPVILVTPSIDKNETIELVWKVLKAFGNTKQYTIVFKFHPDCPYRFIARDTGILPEHFIISDKPSGDLLKESHVLLYTSSATSIEAIALGVPVLHIKSDSTIDRDNLSDFPSSVRESVSTPDDIVKATERLLKMDEKELSRKRLLWAEVVAEMFGTVDESTFDLFL